MHLTRSLRIPIGCGGARKLFPSSRGVRENVYAFEGAPQGDHSYNFLDVMLEHESDIDALVTYFEFKKYTPYSRIMILKTPLFNAHFRNLQFPIIYQYFSSHFKTYHIHILKLKCACME